MTEIILCGALGAACALLWRTWIRLDRVRREFSDYRYRMRREYGDDGL